MASQYRRGPWMIPESPLSFLDYRLDPVSGQLYHDGSPVPLTPKAFSLLGYLAQSAGKLVSKQELLDAMLRAAGKQ
jgi:DNA-binding winged helix-turn-helix (wHTH) protein